MVTIRDMFARAESGELRAERRLGDAVLNTARTGLGDLGGANFVDETGLHAGQKTPGATRSSPAVALSTLFPGNGQR